MSREVRRVPPGWEHPRTAHGHQPQHDETYQDARARLTQSGELECLASPEYYRPAWRDEDRTAYQVYETTTEGTPISPVLETEAALIGWLTRPQPIGIGGRTVTLTEAQARGFIRHGAATMVFDARGLHEDFGEE